MKEEIISVEIAKLAKRVGFDWDTPYKYEGSKLEYMHINYNWNSSREQELWDSPIYSAPTQSLLQKWIREVHDTELVVTCNESGWYWELNKAYPYSGGTFIAWSNDDGPNDGGNWETYEEAMNIGLLFILKIIESENKGKE